MTAATIAMLTAQAEGIEIDEIDFEGIELDGVELEDKAETDVATESVVAEPVEERLELDDGDEWSWEDGADPHLWMYRGRTLMLLKRYMRLSIEVGRLPSVLGREFFRTHVTSYSVSTFEDTVIFVHDVETCLGKLDPFSQALIAKIVLQEYSQDETARLLGCWRRTVGRRYSDALDRLSRMFLDGGLLRPFEEPRRTRKKSCQEGKIDEIPVSPCKEDE